MTSFKHPFIIFFSILSLCLLWAHRTIVSLHFPLLFSTSSPSSQCPNLDASFDTATADWDSYPWSYGDIHGTSVALFVSDICPSVSNFTQTIIRGVHPYIRHFSKPDKSGCPNGLTAFAIVLFDWRTAHRRWYHSRNRTFRNRFVQARNSCTFTTQENKNRLVYYKTERLAWSDTSSWKIRSLASAVSRNFHPFNFLLIHYWFGALARYSCLLVCPRFHSAIQIYFSNHLSSSRTVFSPCHNYREDPPIVFHSECLQTSWNSTYHPKNKCSNLVLVSPKRFLAPSFHIFPVPKRSDSSDSNNYCLISCTLKRFWIKAFPLFEPFVTFFGWSTSGHLTLPVGWTR